jgi:hypothetical protein
MSEVKSPVGVWKTSDPLARTHMQVRGATGHPGLTGLRVCTVNSLRETKTPFVSSTHLADKDGLGY